MKRALAPILFTLIFSSLTIYIAPTYSSEPQNNFSPSMTELYMLKDLDNDTVYPTTLTLVDEQIFFLVAEYPLLVGSLWVTRGDTETLQQLTYDGQGFNLVSFGKGVAFMTGETSQRGDVWVSDGTADGTYLIASATVWNKTFTHLTAADSGLFFVATTAGGSLEFPTHNIAYSDGTAAGTKIIKEFNAGFSNAIEIKAAVRDKVLFTPTFDDVRFANQGSLGLWVSDGTTSGTHELFQTGSGPSDIRYPLMISDTLFFAANHGSEQNELWKSDGTEAGTQLVKDIRLSGSSNPNDLFEFGNELYFSADDGSGEELWKSDGTESGTQKVIDIHPSGGSNPRDFTLWGDRFLFEANDGTHGYELWISDGTESGTQMLKNITAGSASSSIDRITTGGSVAFFRIGSQAIWVTDGTPEGTQFVTLYNPPLFQSFVRAAGDRLYYSNYDEASGAEVWQTDGTAAGTKLIQDLNPQGDSIPPWFLTATAIEGTFFVGATDGTDPELWAIDGITKTRISPAQERIILESDAGQGNDKVAFTVTLNTTLPQTYTVDYITIEDTAIAGEDYVTISGTVTIPAGQRQATFEITIIDDDVIERLRESFYVRLSNPSQGSTGLPRTSTVTILNDDWFYNYVPSVQR